VGLICVRTLCNLFVFVHVMEVTRVAHSSFIVAFVYVWAFCVLFLIVITTFIATDAHSFRMVAPCHVRAVCYFNHDLSGNDLRLSHFLNFHRRFILELIR
jgi:hypothetical protein